MKNKFDFKLADHIENYCKFFDRIIPNRHTTVNNFSIPSSTKKIMSKENYNESIKKIEKYILSQISKIKNIEALSISLFVYRAVTKGKMYEDMDFWTEKFKICNILFFLVKKNMIGIGINGVHVNTNEYEVLNEVVNCVYTLLVNQHFYNTMYTDNVSVEEYFDRVREVSNRVGDMHSYVIQSNDLQAYLNSRKLDVDSLKKKSLESIKDRFITIEQISYDTSWDNIIKRFNLSLPEDDIVIICRNDFEVLDERFRIFLNTFEVSNCTNPFEIENELFFTYATSRYIYISKKIMLDAQTIIEDFNVWGQYENLSKYYFNLNKNEEILAKYNCLMTYKVADVLRSAGYIVPLEKKKSLKIPRVEIKHYTESEECSRSLGDIDVMFYSRKTKILFLVEYKNYQMMVSRQGDLSSEISKVKREGTEQKVLLRQEYVKGNIKKIMNDFFLCTYEIRFVRSILLTTKPNYFFYANKSQDYYYMDWVEFEEKLKKQEL
ncbi:hypothetical protein GCM10008014_49750 [Paenibacillus silvae]|uniref:NERD domain-containing protein n=1 Tax=Paenibacillus silvae TaxID=1325358 RepID=A0ABQ1ZKD1_9BACL|nr:hypothetical protein [Paenibacillus silvae]GGH67867.1 hypothetical protein GCM10008014_49750 [Paenibacillus silvae]